MVRRRPQDDQQWLQDGPQMGPRWPQDDPKMAKTAQQVPRGFKTAKLRQNTVFYTVVGPEDGPKKTPRWPKMAPRWLQDGLKSVPRWSQESQDGTTGPKRAQDSQIEPKHCILQGFWAVRPTRGAPVLRNAWGAEEELERTESTELIQHASPPWLNHGGGGFNRFAHSAGLGTVEQWESRCWAGCRCAILGH